MRQSWEISATGKISLADYYGAEFDWFVPVCLSREIEVGGDRSLLLLRVLRGPDDTMHARAMFHVNIVSRTLMLKHVDVLVFDV